MDADLHPFLRFRPNRAFTMRMRELGIAYVHIGEFAWSRYEPRRGEFQWGWLDRAMNTLDDAGLKIVLGTPTAAPTSGSWTSIRMSRRSTMRAGHAVWLAAALHVLIPGLARKRANSRGAHGAPWPPLGAGRLATNTAATIRFLSWKRRIGYFCSDLHHLDDDEVIAILDRFKPSGREAHSQTK